MTTAAPGSRRRPPAGAKRHLDEGLGPGRLSRSRRRPRRRRARTCHGGHRPVFWRAGAWPVRHLGSVYPLRHRRQHVWRQAISSTIPGSWPRMNLVGVPASILLGHIPSWLGIGERLTWQRLSRWARWCRMRNYFFDDSQLPETTRFSDVRLPLRRSACWTTRGARRAAVAHLPVSL